MMSEVFETVIPNAPAPGKSRRLRYHRANALLTPMNRNRMHDEIQRRKAHLLEIGYPEDAAQYLAESDIVPKYFIIPATDLKQAEFDLALREHALQVLAEEKTLARALIKLEPYGISRNLWRKWTAEPEFKAALDLVMEELGDFYEGLAHDRLINPVPGAGGDRLLARMMESYNPERFVQVKKTEHSGPDGGPIQHKIEGSKARLKAKLNVVLMRIEQGAEIEVPKTRKQLEQVSGAEVIDVESEEDSAD